MFVKMLNRNLPSLPTSSTTLPAEKRSTAGFKAEPSRSMLKVSPTANGALKRRLAWLVSLNNLRALVVRPNAGAPSEFAGKAGAVSMKCGAGC